MRLWEFPIEIFKYSIFHVYRKKSYIEEILFDTISNVLITYNYNKLKLGKNLNKIEQFRDTNYFRISFFRNIGLKIV